MRRASKRDSNEDEIVSALQAEGYSVHRVDDDSGFPDLVVGRPNHLGHPAKVVLMEVKQPGELLTPRQKAWHAAWPTGLAHVVRSPDEALFILQNV